MVRKLKDHYVIARINIFLFNLMLVKSEYISVGMDCNEHFNFHHKTLKWREEYRYLEVLFNHNCKHPSRNCNKGSINNCKFIY